MGPPDHNTSKGMIFKEMSTDKSYMYLISICSYFAFCFEVYIFLILPETSKVDVVQKRATCWKIELERIPELHQYVLIKLNQVGHIRENAQFVKLVTWSLALNRTQFDRRE